MFLSVVVPEGGGSINRGGTYNGVDGNRRVYTFGKGEARPDAVLGHVNEGSDDEEYFVPTVVEALAGKKVVGSSAVSYTYSTGRGPVGSVGGPTAHEHILHLFR